MALLGGIPRCRNLLLVVAALAAATVLLAQDTGPVSASNTSIYFTYSTAYPSPEGNIILNPDGPPVDIHLWVANVDDPDGMVSFRATLVYDPDLATVTNVVEDVQFLESTGRQSLCSSYGPRPLAGNPDGFWEANVSCGSSDISPPAAPVQGSGLLATFTLQPGSEYGLSPYTNDSWVWHDGSPKDNNGDTLPDRVPGEIPATVVSGVMQIVKCADVTGDGAVAAADFFSILSKFGLEEGDPGWAESHDLNGDGAIGAQDFFNTLAQFGMECWQ